MRSSRARIGVCLVGIVVVVAGCSSSSKSAGKPSGPVNVLYAGSLVTLMEHSLGPDFDKQTGYTFTGFSGDSGSLANEIKGKTQVGDVFISASAAKDQLLEGQANGNWVSWYAKFASSPLLLAYNSKSRFAAALKTQPWYQVITEPGFLVGRTDPKTDPKGELTAAALQQAASADHAPGLLTVLHSSANVFPESSLVSRLQSGNLDAGFFYAVEAVSAGLPTVPLSGVPVYKANYTVTVLNTAPHQAAADAFVEFLLGSSGVADLQRAGLSLTSPPALTGNPPAALSSVLGSH